MGVPEASVNKNYGVIAWKNQVWLTGVTLVANPVTKSSLPQSRANMLFGLSVPGTDARHIQMTRFRSKRVHNSQNIMKVFRSIGKRGSLPLC